MATYARSRFHRPSPPSADSPVVPGSGTQQAAPAESEAPCSSLLTGTSERLCAGIRNDGGRCRARPSAGYDFCSFHRQDLQETVHAGRVQGGRHREFAASELDENAAAQLALRLDSRGGIQAGLDAVLRMLFLGKISPSYATAATRVYIAALRNFDRTDRETEDHSLDQYLAALATVHRLSGQMPSPESDRGRARPAAESRAAVDALVAALLGKTAS